MLKATEQKTVNKKKKDKNMETNGNTVKRGRKPVLKSYVDKYLKKLGNRLERKDLDAVIADLSTLRDSKPVVVPVEPAPAVA